MFDLASIFTGQNETAKSQSLDAQLAALNQSEYAPGGRLYNQTLATQGQAAADANWAVVQGHTSSSAQASTTYNAQIADAAVAGAQQGIQNIADFTNGAFFGFLKAIPLAVWIVAGGALFFYMGGASLLKGSLAKKN